jgi:hypothetical protein
MPTPFRTTLKELRILIERYEQEIATLRSLPQHFERDYVINVFKRRLLELRKEEHLLMAPPEQQPPIMNDDYIAAMIRVHRHRSDRGVYDSPLTSAEIADAFEEIQRLRAVAKGYRDDLANSTTCMLEMLRRFDAINNKQKGQC